MGSSLRRIPASRRTVAILSYYRLMPSQMQELACLVHQALAEPWNKGTGRPKSCGLYAAMEIACMYLRQNSTQGGLFKGSDYSRENAAHYRRAYMNRGSILERIWVLNPTSENRALRCIIPRDFPGMRSWSCTR